MVCYVKLAISFLSPFEQTLKKRSCSVDFFPTVCSTSQYFLTDLSDFQSGAFVFVWVCLVKVKVYFEGLEAVSLIPGV